jgi:hypothetical protein
MFSFLGEKRSTATAREHPANSHDRKKSTSIARPFEFPGEIHDNFYVTIATCKLSCQARGVPETPKRFEADYEWYSCRLFTL